MSNVFSGKVTQSRGWTIGIGIAAAVLAAILLIIYLNRYRTSVNDTAAQTPVLVAKNLIPVGTSGDVIAEKKLYQVASYSKDDIKIGAVADPAYLNGRVALTDIFPGQQITNADFSSEPTQTYPSQLSGLQRAVAIPAIGAKNLVGIAQTGDRVDIYYGTGASGGQLLGLLVPNALLLAAPTGEGAPAIFRLPSVAAQTLALASDTGTLWYLLRPAGDAKNAPKRVITQQQLLAADQRQADEAVGVRVDSRPIKALVSVIGIDARDVQQALPRDGSLQLVGVAEDTLTTARGLEGTACDILVVACSGEIDSAIDVIRDSRHSHPILPILVLSLASPSGFLREAFDVGATDIVTFPLSPEQLTFAMNKAHARRSRRPDGSPSHESSLICVLGPKGGTGKTLTSCNLAVAFAEAGKSVLMVDLDLQFGDVALCLGLSPETTIYDLAVSGGSLDVDKLKAYVTRHASGVEALLAPNRPDQASVISTELLRSIYTVARENYDFIVVDTPPGFTGEVIATIDSSTDLIMVGMLDSLSLKNTKLGLETLELMGYDRDKMRLVLNRAQSRVGISQGDVVAILGKTPDVFVPSDREIPRTVNEGIPIITARPQSEAAAAFRTLAALFTGIDLTLTVANSQPSGSKRKFFGRKD